ncbi:MAG: hypothetical protein EXS25_06410 [Pedosphaera sp.]|nr:hypothetical protein [Pedosphaera sp.]
MIRLIIVLITGLLFEAIGVVCLSRGLREIGEMDRISVSEFVRLIRAAVTNHQILLGITFEAIFFGCLLYLMSRGDVSFVWPLTSIGFVLTTFAARWILHEEVSFLRWIGVSLIVLGAGIITYTEKFKSPKAPSKELEAQIDSR